MEYSPPPFFKQGPSANARLVFFALLALILLFVDARYATLVLVRQGLATALQPVQRIALLPSDWFAHTQQYFSAAAMTQNELNKLRAEKIVLAQQAMQAQQLQAENNQLRKLLATRERITLPGLAAEILYEAHNPFSQKIVIDRGLTQGISLGQPVIDDLGVIGQVTRVLPFSAEVTLLIDKDQAIPVQVVRSGLRAVAYGAADGQQLELRFTPANADVREGDVLVTSGLDEIYPPGLPVARITHIERSAVSTFARITCMPIAGVKRYRHVLVLLHSEKLKSPQAESVATPALVADRVLRHKPH